MSEIEMIFETTALSVDQESKLEDHLDAFIGGHGTTTLVTVSTEADSVMNAARRVVAAFHTMGITAVRLYPDLVTRKTIADRAHVSAQAVGMWIRGERMSRVCFPKPYTLAAGGLWLWPEVNEWLRANDLTHDKDLSFPARADYDRVNSWLTNGAKWFDDRPGVFRADIVYTEGGVLSPTFQTSEIDEGWEPAAFLPSLRLATP